MGDAKYVAAVHVECAAICDINAAADMVAGIKIIVRCSACLAGDVASGEALIGPGAADRRGAAACRRIVSCRFVCRTVDQVQRSTVPDLDHATVGDIAGQDVVVEVKGLGTSDIDGARSRDVSEQFKCRTVSRIVPSIHGIVHSAITCKFAVLLHQRDSGVNSSGYF